MDYVSWSHTAAGSTNLIPGHSPNHLPKELYSSALCLCTWLVRPLQVFLIASIHSGLLLQVTSCSLFNPPELVVGLLGRLNS